MEAYFRVTPPSVHRMVVELERRGLIRRVPRQPRSIQLCLSLDVLPQRLRQLQGLRERLLWRQTLHRFHLPVSGTSDGVLRPRAC